jgi:tetratricopeptide (TPR) repeat protein
MRPIRWALLILPLAALAQAARGQTADQEAGQGVPPYKIVVCLRFGDDPLLTRAFLEAVRDQVRGQLETFFRPLASVEVPPIGHWLLDKQWVQGVRDPSLAKLLAEHDGTEQLFFVSVDRRQGRYEVAWRRLDVEFQHVGPVRVETTPDRQWIAKAICLAVRDGFSPVALVTTPDTVADPKSPEMNLTFRGSELDGRLARWLGPDCVLQPFAVTKQRDGRLVRRPVAHTLLRIKPGSENHRAWVASNASEPFRQTASIVRFEAVKLPTREAGRIRLRLVDTATGLAATRFTVSANDQGFDTIEEDDVQGTPDSEGFILLRTAFRHMAYLKLALGEGNSIRIPMAITDEVCELSLTVRTDPGAADKNDFQRDLRFLVQDVRTLDSALDEAFREINRLNQGKRYEEALAEVERTHGLVEKQLITAQEDVVELRRKEQKLGLDGKTPLLTWAAGKVADQPDPQAQDGDILERRDRLRQLSTSLSATIDKLEAQDRANVLVNLGGEAELSGDIDEALDRYKLALEEQPDQPQLRQKIERLEAEWTIKGPAHEAARKLIYETWSAAQVTEIESLLKELKQALATLRQAGDRLSALKLLKVTGDRLSDLSELVGTLSGRTSPEDLAELEKYVKLTEDLAAFQEEVGQFAKRQGDTSAPSSTAPETPAQDTQAQDTEETPDDTSAAPTDPPADSAGQAEEEEEPSEE